MSFFTTNYLMICATCSAVYILRSPGLLLTLLISLCMFVYVFMSRRKPLVVMDVTLGTREKTIAAGAGGSNDRRRDPLPGLHVCSSFVAKQGGLFNAACTAGIAFTTAVLACMRSIVALASLFCDLLGCFTINSIDPCPRQASKAEGGR